jgi:hypothetical protein
MRSFMSWVHLNFLLRAVRRWIRSMVVLKVVGAMVFISCCLFWMHPSY